MDVGVRELKKHLSEYIERAADGEIVRITVRGKPTAYLGPLPGRWRLDEGIREGWIRPGDGTAPVAVQAVESDRSIQSALDDDRGT